MIGSSGKRCEGHMARVGEKRNAHRVIVVKSEGKTPLGVPRVR
jgi:hypothetical protein